MRGGVVGSRGGERRGSGGGIGRGKVRVHGASRGVRGRGREEETPIWAVGTGDSGCVLKVIWIRGSHRRIVDGDRRSCTLGREGGREEGGREGGSEGGREGGREEGGRVNSGSLVTRGINMVIRNLILINVP